MRPQPIIIPGLERFAANEARAHVAKNGDRYLKDDLQEPAIEGYATRYGEVHKFQGQDEVFAPGCFADWQASGEPIKFQIDHDSAMVVASTRDHLEVFDDEDGLAFRLRIPKNHLGEMVRGMVASGDRASMSVAYKEVAAQQRTIAGRQVRFITKAKLLELSCVRRGAVRSTFARAVDAATAPPLRDAVRRRDFKLRGSYQRLLNAQQTYIGHLDRQLDAVDVLREKVGSLHTHRR